MCIRDREAAREWQSMLDTPRWPKDNKGKDGAQRVLCHMFDEVEGFSESAEQNQLELEGPAKKNPTESEVGGMIGELGKNLQGFDAPNLAGMLGGLGRSAQASSALSFEGYAPG
eukprot:12759239-Alexandrium_andersonii.AAC.1